MTTSLILGTAGHIDHGKTALIKALTGIDTDRLREEKERGITIDLGFAEIAGDDLQLGIVDVPGHEGFVRNMLAGATGMDVVLLVVAADEGVMPQTREHVAIVSLLDVSRMVVAITKSDLVEPEWIELVEDEVRELLGEVGLGEPPVVVTSARTGQGLPELRRALAEAASPAGTDRSDDRARLPLDRVFTIRGTGTVVTGTLWSGILRTGDRVLVRPGGIEARIRSLQVHGREVQEARAGQRTAVALAGADVDREELDRGQALVDHHAWPESTMLTARVEVLPDGTWMLEHNQRVRLHLGTAEVMARVVLLDREAPLLPGERGWAQLRLEDPVVARTGERFVMRSYSPVTTMGGGVVAEPDPPKRTSLDGRTRDSLDALLAPDPRARVSAAVRLAGFAGADVEEVPVLTGLPPSTVEVPLRELTSRGGMIRSGTAFHPEVVAEVEAVLTQAVENHHAREPLRPGKAVEELRTSLHAGAHGELVDAVLARLRERGEIRIHHGVVARVGFEPELTDAQARLRHRLIQHYRDAGLEAPAVDDLPPDLGSERALWPILRLLEAGGELTLLEEERFIWSEVLDHAMSEVRDRLGGRDDLGPTDFRAVLPVSRKHLIPILGYFDTAGLTVRQGGGRTVIAPGE